MSIGVVFEVLLSALAVFGIYAIIREIDHAIFCRRCYHIAVDVGRDTEDIDMILDRAWRIARDDSGAADEIVLLLPHGADISGYGELSQYDVLLYVPYVREDE